MERGADHRVLLPDQRGSERCLRVTWHRTSSTVVFSHWVGDACVATTSVALRDAAQLVDLISGAIEDAAPLESAL